MLMKKMFSLSSKLSLPCIGAALMCACSSQQAAQTAQGEPLVAKRYYSGYNQAHDTYNAITAASDGNIYYVLSSTTHDKAGEMHLYNPKADKTELICDLTEAVGEKDMKAIAQGKSHVEFEEYNGKLYFATHLGYYEMINGAENIPVTAPDGYKLYVGGHFVAYDMANKTFESLAIAPEGEGIITMAMDKERGHLYGITWPRGLFIDYDMNTKTLRNLGPTTTTGLGESGKLGQDYRVVCRSILVDPNDGTAYYSNAEGDIMSYVPGAEKVELMDGVNLRKDYFGKYDASDAGSMGYHWRKIFWYGPENVAYGVHGNSGYLFKFDPKAKSIEMVERLTSEPSRKSGMFDLFSYGYLGYKLGPDNETIYYLTGGPVYEDGKRVTGLETVNMGMAKGLENLHLVTYNIPNKKYTDHGPIFYEDGQVPTYVNSLTIGNDGYLYTLARYKHEGKEIEDLVKIPDPLYKK